jgi:3-keto-disaccharide hydrolase
MRQCCIPWVLWVLWVLCVPFSARAQSPDEIKDGFVSLFNGKDFSGWRFGNASAFGKTPDNWSVASELIKLKGGGSPHLASQWDYEDFDVRIEWMAHKKGYNSGFYIRSGRAVNANQINLAEKDCGHLIYGVPGGPAVPKLQKPPGEWNEWRVLAVGDKLTLWCNGEKAWELTGFKPARGYLGLQAEGAAIDFKNLRIKELGYTPLNDLKQWQAAAGWKQVGDALVAEADAKPLVYDKMPAQFTLRLEYQGRAAVQRGGKTLLALSDTDIAKNANPAKQWNYLELATGPKGLRIIINGVAATRMNEGGIGELTIVPTEPLALRNVRVRAEKQ